MTKVEILSPHFTDKTLSETNREKRAKLLIKPDRENSCSFSVRCSSSSVPSSQLLITSHARAPLRFSRFTGNSPPRRRLLQPLARPRLITTSLSFPFCMRSYQLHRTQLRSIYNQATTAAPLQPRGAVPCREEREEEGEEGLVVADTRRPPGIGLGILGPFARTAGPRRPEDDGYSERALPRCPLRLQPLPPSSGERRWARRPWPGTGWTGRRAAASASTRRAAPCCASSRCVPLPVPEANAASVCGILCLIYCLFSAFS